MLRRKLAREEGQTMAEYGVVLGVIAPTLIIALVALSGAVEQLLERVLAIVPR